MDFHTNIGNGLHFDCRVEDLLADMEQNGVDKAVICPVEQYLSVHNREGNRLIADIAAKYPEKLVGFGCASPWYGKSAAAEIERFCEIGLKGVKFHPFYQGFMLNDEIIYPLIEACGKYGLTALFHTGTPVSAMPFQLRDLALRYPEVVFVMGHMGWSDFWYDVVHAVRDTDNVFLETSYQMLSVIRNCMDGLSGERLLFGSDWPYSSMRLEKDKLERLGAGAGLREILGLNALRLLDRAMEDS